VISPEGFASILLRDAKKAQQAAALMKMTAPDLKRFGVIDEIIPEPPGGAQADHERIAGRVRQRVLAAHRELKKKRPDALLRERSERLMALGRFEERPVQGSSRRPRFLGGKR
jgi:acetyl-CoA carboxylase carboxyl transferase subunit alpha